MLVETEYAPFYAIVDMLGKDESRLARPFGTLMVATYLNQLDPQANTLFTLIVNVGAQADALARTIRGSFEHCLETDYAMATAEATLGLLITANQGFLFGENGKVS